MAKKSAVNRNLRVQALVKQYAAKRDALKAIAVDEACRSKNVLKPD
jgi:small subunit ribosomal protein S14